jgi:serine/threonine protein kinase
MPSPSYDFLSPPQSPDEIGRLGCYRILQLLGEGGMGMVFKAEDVNLQRPVALKVMKPEVACNPSSLQRFVREARAAAALKHDHIVTIYQVEHETTVPFLAMEFLQGEPLDRWLQRHRPTFRQALKLAREIALGLQAAHERGLIHRDIKPANIWLEAPRGRVKILDFGLARATDGDSHLTQSGAILGTPAYMAPEQARSEKVDARSDLFSLGVVLYRLLTGEMPFRGDTLMAVLYAVTTHDPRPVHELNAAVPRVASDLITRLLAKRPEDRPQSAREVVAGIDALFTATAPPQRGDGAPPSQVPTVPEEEPWPATAFPAEAVQTSRTATHQKAQTVKAEKAPPSTKRLRARPDRKAPSGRHLALVAGGAALGVALVAGLVLLLTRKGEEAPGKPQGPAATTNAATINAPALAKAVPPAQPNPVAGQAGPKPPPPPPPVGGALGLYPLEHARTVTRVVFSPDGKWLASGSDDTRVKIWDVVTGKERATVPQHGMALGLAFSRDGKVLACWALAPRNRKVLKFWEVPTGQEVPLFALDKLPGPVAFSPDGQTFATAGPNGTVLLYDLATKKEIATLASSKTDRIFCLAFDPDGKRLAAGRQQTALTVWDVAARKELFWVDEKAAQAAVRGAHCVAFTRDGTKVLLGAEAALSLHDASTGQRLWKFRRHLFYVNSISLNPDGKLIATAGTIGDFSHAIITELATKKTIRELPAWRGYEKGGKGALALAFSPDGKLLVTAGPDHTLKVWETAHWEERVLLDPKASKGGGKQP